MNSVIRFYFIDMVYLQKISRIINKGQGNQAMNLNCFHLAFMLKIDSQISMLV